jgi:hypothetical protein
VSILVKEMFGFRTNDGMPNGGMTGDDAFESDLFSGMSESDDSVFSTLLERNQRNGAAAAFCSFGAAVAVVAEGCSRNR